MFTVKKYSFCYSNVQPLKQKISASGWHINNNNNNNNNDDDSEN